MPKHQLTVHDVNQAEQIANSGDIISKEFGNELTDAHQLQHELQNMAEGQPQQMNTNYHEFNPSTTSQEYVPRPEPIDLNQVEQQTETMLNEFNSNLSEAIDLQYELSESQRRMGTVSDNNYSDSF